MEPGGKWRQLFSNWPEEIAKKGLITTNLDELIPFKGFMISDDMMVLERTTPDPSGTRFILLGFETINCVKLIDALKGAHFAKAGFVGSFSKR